MSSISAPTRSRSSSAASEESSHRVSDSELGMISFDELNESYSSCQDSENEINTIDQEKKAMEDSYKTLQTDYEIVSKERDTLRKELLKASDEFAIYIQQEWEDRAQMNRHSDNLEAEVDSLNYAAEQDAKEISNLTLKLAQAEETLKRVEKEHAHCLLTIESGFMKLIARNKTICSISEETSVKDAVIRDLEAELASLNQSTERYLKQVDEFLDGRAVDKETIMKQATKITELENELKKKEVSGRSIDEKTIELIEKKLNEAQIFLRETSVDFDKTFKDMSAHHLDMFGENVRTIGEQRVTILELEQKLREQEDKNTNLLGADSETDNSGLIEHPEKEVKGYQDAEMSMLAELERITEEHRKKTSADKITIEENGMTSFEMDPYALREEVHKILSGLQGGSVADYERKLAAKDAEIKELKEVLEQSGKEHQKKADGDMEMMNDYLMSIFELQQKLDAQEVEINNLVWDRHEAFAADFEKKLAVLRKTITVKDAEFKDLKAEYDRLYFVASVNQEQVHNRQVEICGNVSSWGSIDKPSISEEDHLKQINPLLEKISKDQDTITQQAAMIIELEQEHQRDSIAAERAMNAQLTVSYLAEKRLEDELKFTIKQMTKEANERNHLSLKMYQLEQASELERMAKNETIREMIEKNEKLMESKKTKEQEDQREKEELKMQVEKYKTMAYEYKMKCHNEDAVFFPEQFNGTWKCVHAEKPVGLRLAQRHESWTAGKLILKLEGRKFKTSVEIGGVEKVDTDVELVDKRLNTSEAHTYINKQRLTTIDTVLFSHQLHGSKTVVFRTDRYIENGYLKIRIKSDDGVARFTFKKIN